MHEQQNETHRSSHGNGGRADLRVGGNFRTRFGHKSSLLNGICRHLCPGFLGNVVSSTRTLSRWLNWIRHSGQIIVNQEVQKRATSGSTKIRPQPLMAIQARPPGNLHSSAGELMSYSVMTRSAHSTSETKIAGLPNFAPHWSRSVCITLRAREQAPHA